MRPIRSLLLLAASLAAAAVAACSWVGGDPWKPPQVVSIQGNQEVSALMPTWGMWHTVSEKGAPQGLLLRDGDYFLGDDALVRYRASDGQALVMTWGDWNTKLGEKTVTVLLDKDKSEDGGAWLKGATDQQLADLRTLAIEDDIDPAVLPAIRRLAAVNPGVDLSVQSSAAQAQVLPLFRPRTVFGLENPEVRDALASQPQIEMLYMEASEPGSLEFLPGLRGLRTLLLGKWDVAAAGPLPADMPALKSLLIMEADGLIDLKPLGTAATGLEELSLIGLDDFTDLSGIEKMTSLRTLILWSDAEARDLSILNGLKELRWVALPSWTSQEQFASFVAAHPKLEILDLSAKSSIGDLAPLGTLRDLHGLVLGGPYDNLAPVQALTSLRFVGISNKTWEADPDQAEAIRKALPDALVVQVAPFCLGSGWILLLVPVPVVAWLIRRRSLAFRL